MRKAFESIVGNRELCHRLENHILSGTLPHAVILEGPYGTGKHTVAKTCAAALFCHSAGDSGALLPCLRCSACKKVMEGNSPDLITVGRGDKATIGVETVRFLREDVHVIPNDGEKKVYVIEDADKMTSQAQNALLLTLEEPPPYAHFFLLCENASLLLETIRSRAPVLRTQRLTAEEIDRYLCERDLRAAQMKRSDPKTYGEILAASGLGIGRALELLEPKEWKPVSQIRALATELLRAAVRQEGARSVLPLLNRFSPKRDTLRTQLLTLSEAARDLILLKKSDDAPLSFFADRSEAMELSDKASLPFLYQLGEAIRQAIDENGRNANVRLLLIKLALSAELI